jgi:hypothetical protein
MRKRTLRFLRTPKAGFYNPFPISRQDRSWLLLSLMNCKSAAGLCKYYRTIEHHGNPYVGIAP